MIPTVLRGADVALAIIAAIMFVKALSVVARRDGRMPAALALAGLSVVVVVLGVAQATTFPHPWARRTTDGLLLTMVGLMTRAGNAVDRSQPRGAYRARLASAMPIRPSSARRIASYARGSGAPQPKAPSRKPARSGRAVPRGYRRTVNGDDALPPPCVHGL